MEGIAAISFDGDGTLWDFEKVMRQSLSHALGELRRVDSEAAAMLTIEKMIEIRNRVALELRGKVTNLEAVRLEAFRRTLQEVGKPDETLAEHLNAVYLKHRFEDAELYDDVMPALSALRENYIIGLLSNGNSYPERTGLPGIFQFVVFSQDYGIEKPDPKIFRIALEKAGCSNEQLLHVGDSLSNDVVGAKAAGIRSVWLNRLESTERNTDVDFEIRSLRELPGLLRYG